MTHLLSLGAINKLTGEYVYPKIANKKDEYICPECNKDLILCQGEIRVHHFRHKVDSINPCHHYSNPTETQIHKDAKILLKNLLERKIPISFIRNCCCCKKNEEFEIPEITETSIIQLEYRFEYNGVKIADVAYIDDNDILCIFEICNTHKTCSENRPEPWFEINAETLIKIANDNTLSSLQIPCVRCEKCEDCIKEEKRRIILQKIYLLEQLLQTITGWGASKSEKNEKSKLRKQIKKLNEELLSFAIKKPEIMLTKDEKMLRSNCDIEKELIINDIEYSYIINNGTRIYEIKIPNTDKHIRYSCSSKKIYMDKKWHKYLNLNSIIFGKIYLNIPFKDKDEFKNSYCDGCWDSEKKLWYISKNHKDKDIILSKWTQHKIN
jgi:hypothetical protein